MKTKLWDEEERVWAVGADGGPVAMFPGSAAVEGSV